MPAVLSKSELDIVSSTTIQHYEVNANAFWEGTKDHDVGQNYKALLSHLPPQANLEILDFGCGPGRDVRYFKSLGHNPTGLDGCMQFCKRVRETTGCPTLQQDFLALKLLPQSFHGVFANASLFHIPAQELVRVLKDLHGALKPGGVLFSSNPRGEGEGWNGGRFGNYMELEEYTKILTEAGFQLIHHYYRPEGPPRSEQHWLAVVSRKV